MADLRTTLGNAIRTGACTLLDIPDAIDRLVDFPPSGTGILGQLDDFTDGVRDGYRDLICPAPDDNPYAPGLPNPTIPPIPGGQCPVEYDLSFTLSGTRVGTGVPVGPDNRTVRIIGPFEGFVPGNPNLGDFAGGFIWGAAVQAAAIVTFGPTTWQSGAAVLGLPNPTRGGQTTPPGGTQSAFINGNGGGGGFTVENIQVTNVVFTRVDGQPDNCPEQGPPPPPFIDDPIEYDPPTGAPITIAPVIIFNPINIDINNNVRIPVNITYNDVDIQANLNLNIGSIEFNFGNGDGDGGDCCPPPQVPELPPADPEPEPPPATEERIAGVIVTVTQVSDDANFTEVFVPNGPSLFFPDLGLVIFRVRTENVLSWLAPVRIQNRRQFIPVNWREGAVDVVAQAREGANLTLTVVYDDYNQV